MKRRRKHMQPAQDHGIGEFRFHDRQRVKRRRRYRKLMRQGVLVLLCAVIVLSASMVVGIVVRSVRTRQLNRELAERRDQMEPAVLSAQTPQPTAADVQETVLVDVSEPESEPSPTMEPAPTADAPPAVIDISSAIPAGIIRLVWLFLGTFDRELGLERSRADGVYFMRKI